MSVFAELLDRGFDHASLESQADHVMATLRDDVKVAKSTHDDPLLALTSKRLATATELRAEHDLKLDALEQAEASYRSAIERALRAAAVVNAGTLDEVQAMQNEAEYTAALAAERYWAGRMPSARTAVSAPLHRLIKLANDEDAKARARALEQAAGYVGSLFSAYSQDDAASRAQADGRAATAALAIWFPFGAALARSSFLELEKKATIPIGAGPRWKPPTIADFERCVAARAAGFEQARAQARAKVAALEGAA